MPFEPEAFRRFCLDSAAQMIAAACGDEKTRISVPCLHGIGGALSAADESAFDDIDPATREELLRFYGQFAAADLFVVDEEPGLELTRPGNWDALAGEIRDWWGGAADELEDDLVVMLNDAIVFARIPGAATYFCLVRSGELAGQVALFSGPGLEFAPVADSFGDFLAALPTKGVRWISTDVRYESEDVADQFYPIEYRPSIGAAPMAGRVVRVALESASSRKIARYEYTSTLENGADIRSPAGHTYSIVVELYQDNETSIDISDDNSLYVFVRGFGNMDIQARLRDGDVANIAVNSR